MLTSLALIFLIGLILSALFQKLNLPGLLGMLVTGMLLSPYAFDLLDESILSISPDLRRLALVIILLKAGLSLDLNDLKKVGRPAILMCFVPAVLEITAITLIAPLLFGITLLEAAVMGSVLAAVSPAVVVPRMVKLMEEGYGTNKSIPQLILAGASVDDVFVIVLFTAFTSLALGGDISAGDFLQVPISIVAGLIVGLLFGWLLSKFFKALHMRDSVKLLIVLSLSFLLMEAEELLTGILPMSGLLAVMSMGIMLYRSYGEVAGRLSSKFSRLWVAAEILLFVLVGATVDLSYALSAGLTAIVVVVGALAFRMLGVYLSVVKTNLSAKEKLFCMVAYTPKATVQAAIGAVPLSMGLPVGQLVLTVAVLSILITAPFGAVGVDRNYKNWLSLDEK